MVPIHSGQLIAFVVARWAPRDEGVGTTAFMGGIVYRFLSHVTLFSEISRHMPSPAVFTLARLLVGSRWRPVAQIGGDLSKHVPVFRKPSRDPLDTSRLLVLVSHIFLGLEEVADLRTFPPPEKSAALTSSCVHVYSPSPTTNRVSTIPSAEIYALDNSARGPKVRRPTGQIMVTIR